MFLGRVCLLDERLQVEFHSGTEVMEHMGPGRIRHIDFGA